MKKCKIIFLSTLILILIFGTTSYASDYIFNGETIPATSSKYDNFYGVDTVTNILDDLGIAYDDITKVSWTYQVNKAYKYFKENKDNTANVMNVCFHKYGSSKFFMSFTNGSFSNTLKYMAIDTPYNQEKQPIQYFDNWLVSDGNNYGIKYTAPFLILVTQDRIDTYTQSLSMTNGTENEQISASSINYKNMLAPVKTFVIATKSPTTGYSWYFVDSTIRFTKNSGDTGGGTGGNTSGDNSGDTGGGSPSVDLTMTNEKIDQLNKHAEEIKNKIPTSGEIASATTQGNENYWGNSGELNGEKQEEEIQGAVNEIMDTMSGELSQNEIFQGLEQAESGFLDLFKNKQKEETYDLAFNWEDVKYNNMVIIPAGGINISQMCREIPELGKIQGIIRAIFCFGTSISIIKQIYNLILSTLGIDNPYLYETPETDMYTYDTDLGTGNTIETHTHRQGNKTFKYRRKL